MKNWICVTLFVMLLGASSFSNAGELFLELGIGVDKRIGDEERSTPRSVIRFRYEISRDNEWWSPDVIEIDHHSSVLNGKPFNDRSEDLTDQFSLIWRFKLFD